MLAGGPCAYNPEPYAPFFDVILVGEGEEQLPEVLALIRELRASGAPRAEILREVARRVGGAYVPSLYRWRSEDEAQAAGSWAEPLFDDVPRVVHKRVFEGFADSPALEPMIVPYTEVVHDRLNVEILRGCARGCRFCQAGMMYRPVRERSADNIVDAVARGLAETGYDEVSLTSLSSTDHSQIAEILSRVNADCAAIDAAFAAGWRRCKLYFMVGLPTETDDDIKGIASLAQRAYDRAKAAVPPEQRGSVRMSVSCAVFVPKAQTPFQWDGQISPEETLRRVGLLKRSVKYKAVDVHYHDPATSFVEAVMSRGGREVADWVEAAWRRGARFDAWTELFNEEAWTGAAEELGLDPAAIAQAEFPTDYVLPWAHITAAVSPKFLARERERAAAGITTPDCTFENCSACGACPTLGVDIELQQEREGKEAAPAANPYRKIVHPREAEPPCHPDQARQAEGSTEEEAIR